MSLIMGDMCRQTVDCQVMHVGEVVRGGISTFLRVTVPAQQQAYGRDAVFGVFPACFSDDLEGVFVSPIHVPWTGRGPLSLGRYWLQIYRIVRTIRPRIIHAHSTFPGLVVRLVVAVMSRPDRPIVVYCAHGWSFLQDIPEWKRVIYAYVERTLLPFTNALIHISNDEAHGAAKRGISAPIDEMIYNGLPEVADVISDQRQNASRKIVILFVGRLDRQKGIDILLEAFRRSGRSDIVLNIVGGQVVPGAGFDVVGTDRRVTFHGWMPTTSLQEFYRQSDVVILPSRWEGFGFVAVEAMRAGRAVFAAARGALPELVVDGVTGRLFDPDKPETLTELINSAQLDNLWQMGSEGRRRFSSTFTAKESSARLLSLYNKVMSNAHGATPQLRASSAGDPDQ